eukprot:CAMPEP_0185756916 /NCGR_PEP_ID=MMETSP1174-20130828/15309_1 /TAXON_ID=35687 /ORGANISM="Dictyocha speculum, Strain CCMP1381" /LENGTH=42 /DNA_ID= /DNA_START= /DNA_END= /DNA_ORIENTATION=
MRDEKAAWREADAQTTYRESEAMTLSVTQSPGAGGNHKFVGV